MTKDLDRRIREIVALTRSMERNDWELADRLWALDAVEFEQALGRLISETRWTASMTPILMLPLDRDLTPTERTTILERWMPRPLDARDWRQLDHDLTRLAAECERLQLRAFHAAHRDQILDRLRAQRFVRREREREQRG